MGSVLEATGARVLWQGRADSLVIGGVDERWDVVVLVEYPSRQAFLEMVSSPGYREIGKRRTAALVDSRLIACTQLHPAGWQRQACVNRRPNSRPTQTRWS